jgi:hypothetical protein
VAVPRLSDLRQAAGEARFESGTIGTIRRMIADGSLPPRECVLTGEPTEGVCYVKIQCESVWIRSTGTSNWWLILLVPILPFWSLLRVLTLQAPGRTREYLGRDTFVSVPVSVCNVQQDRLRWMSPWELSRLLRKIPIYAKLLDEYRGARLSVD